MALIIEHGGGSEQSGGLAGAIQGLAGFAQGQEAGRLRRIEEERAERAERRTALAASVSLEMQKLELEQAPERLQLERDAQTAADDARDKAHTVTMAEIARREKADELAGEDRAGNRELQMARIIQGDAEKELNEFKLTQLKESIAASMPDQSLTTAMIITQMDNWKTEFPDALAAMSDATQEEIDNVMVHNKKHPDGHPLEGQYVISPEQRLEFLADQTADLARAQVQIDAKKAYESSSELLSEHQAARERAEAQGAPTDNFLSDDEVKAYDDELESAQASANPVEALRSVQKRITEAMDLSNELDSREEIYAGILGQVESQVAAWVAAGDIDTDPNSWSVRKGSRLAPLLVKLRKTSAHSNEVETLYHQIMSILDPNHGADHDAAVAAELKEAEKRQRQQGEAAAKDLLELKKVQKNLEGQIADLTASGATSTQAVTDLEEQLKVSAEEMDRLKELLYEANIPH